MRYVYAIVKDGTTTPDDDILTVFFASVHSKKAQKKGKECLGTPNKL